MCGTPAGIGSTKKSRNLRRGATGGSATSTSALQAPSDKARSSGDGLSDVTGEVGLEKASAPAQ